MSTVISLKAAELASGALAALHDLRDQFELEQPIKASTDLMNCALAQTLRDAGANGHSYTPPCLSCDSPIGVTDGAQSPSSAEELPPASSAWEPGSVRDVNRCKALLLEILRRAAHDWVLYRTHRKMGNRELAEDAYTWLFEEDEEHPRWRQRVANETTFTSFLSICECLDLDPGQVRDRVKQMDVRSIIASGRPAETRRVRKDAPTVEECTVNVNVNVDTPAHSEYTTQYESYGSIDTPAMLSLSDVPGIW